MSNIVQKRWRMGALCGAILTGMTVCAYALIVSLDVYVAYPLLDENDIALADGMTVLIVGSSNSVNDGMATYGGTNYLATSTQGDDVLLATITINSNTAGFAGGFFATITYDSDQVSYVYMRFFNAPPGSLTGMIYWGQSTVVQLGVTLGVSTVQFDPDGSLKTTNYNNFVVIPEPSTANLFVLVAGMLCAMRTHMRRKELRETGT